MTSQTWSSGHPWGSHARARQRAALLEREAAYLLEWVIPGGKVLDKDLLAVFQEWNPEIDVNSYRLTTAVSAVTGLKKTPSNSKQYWVGFHLPTAEELGECTCGRDHEKAPQVRGLLVIGRMNGLFLKFFIDAGLDRSNVIHSLEQIPIAVFHQQRQETNHLNHNFQCPP